MDPVCFMSDSLREFNYPNVQTMDDAAIMDVFSKSNRFFLVGWFFKQLDEEYCEVVDKASKEDLADLIYYNGFCSSREKYKFMDGESDISLQVSILFKMFNYLKSVSDAKKDTPTEVMVAPVTEIESLLQCDLNLFSQYGPTQTLNLAEQVERIGKYRKEIKNIQNQINSNGETYKEINPSLKEQLKSILEHLDVNFSLFATKMLDIMKSHNLEDTNSTVCSEDLPEIAGRSSEYFNTVLKFIKSINVVTNFMEKTPKLSGNINHNAMVRELAELCKETSNLKKDII